MKHTKKVVLMGSLGLVFSLGTAIYFSLANQQSTPKPTDTSKICSVPQDDLIYRSVDESVIVVEENENLCLDEIWNYLHDQDTLYLYSHKTGDTRILTKKQNDINNLQPGRYGIYTERTDGEIINLSKLAYVEQSFSLQNDDRIIALN